MIVQVKYYEYMYVITDDKGERVYTGTNEEIARTTLKLLNSYYQRKKLKK